MSSSLLRSSSTVSRSMLTTDRRGDRQRTRAGSRCRRTNGGCPSWSRCSEASTIATLIPHTGSIADSVDVGGALADGTAGLSRPGRDDLGEDRQRNFLWRASTDVEPSGRVHAGLHRCADVDRRRCTASPRLRLATRPTYGTSDCSAATRTSSSSRPCDAITTAAVSPGSALAYAMPAWPSGPTRSSSARAIGVSPATTTNGAGIDRFEEDLQRAARQARIVHRQRTGSRLPRGSGVIRSSKVSPESRSASACGAHRGLRARAADETFDGPVGEHDCFCTRLRAGRLLRHYDAGVHVRSPRMTQL